MPATIPTLPTLPSLSPANAIDPYAAEVLADSPVAYWRMEDAAGTTMVDSSGNGHDGTYTNTPTLGVAGQVGNAVTFTAASSEHAYASGLASIGDVFTLECWVKFNTLADQHLLNLGQLAGGLYAGSDGRIYVVLVFGSVITQSTTLLADTTGFHHLVVSKNAGTSTKLYIDKVDVTDTVTNDTSAASTKASLAAWTTDGSAFGGYADVTLDEAAIYDTALSAARVAAHFDAA